MNISNQVYLKNNFFLLFFLVQNTHLNDTKLKFKIYISSLLITSFRN